jgi:hypothetical protein
MIGLKNPCYLLRLCIWTTHGKQMDLSEHCMLEEAVFYGFGKAQQGIRLYPAIIYLSQDTERYNMLQLPNQWITEEYLPRVQRTGREKTIPLRHPFMNTLSPYSILKVLSWITASRNFIESHESFGGVCRLHLGS